MRIELSNLRLVQYLLRVPFISHIISALQTKEMFKKSIENISGDKYEISETHLNSLYEGNLHLNGNYRMPDTIKYLDDRYRFQNTRWIPNLNEFAANNPTVKINILWGDKDSVAPISIANRLWQDLKNLNNTRFYSKENLGHFYMLENPKEFSLKFLSLFS